MTHRWVGLIAVALGAGALSIRAAQEAGAPAAPVQLTAQADRQRIMDLLQIASIPPGAQGSNNPATYDESQANPFPALPDPLVLKGGKKVTSKDAWWKQRRPEILEDFEREIYGRTPAHTPKVRWEVTSREDSGATITKQLVGHVDNSSYPLVEVNIQLTLVTPSNATGPVPVMMQFGFAPGARGRGPAAPAAPSAQTPAAPPPPAAPRWQDQVLAKGWGYASLVPNSIQSDNGAGLTQGIIGLVNKGQPRKLDDWGALAAWAWGASRALDYFETDKAVDAKQVGIEGHSRYGKATIVAMALDQRFAIAYVSSSGAGGTKLHRRKFGELVENVLAANEYHWMAGNYFKYGGHWDRLPVDSHELIALCAPRPVFISAGATNGDGWVDAKGSFLAAAGAGPVYKLLGRKDLGATEFPPIDTTLITGDLGFRQHTGGHTDGPTWPTFLTFADKYIKRIR
jgi:(4-O-methyl)-D-glucuronate---lignin esterase